MKILTSGLDKQFMTCITLNDNRKSMATNKKQQLTDQMKGYIRTTVYNELIRKGCTLDMAKHLIENFIAGKPGSKEELIDAWELDTIRICEYCGMPMFEGYLVNDLETYCSEKCAREAMAWCWDEDTFNEHLANADSEDACIYWTQWEG